jgi:hypothetical protein
MEILQGSRTTLAVRQLQKWEENGSWIHYNKNDQLEYQETLETDRIVKSNLSGAALRRQESLNQLSTPINIRTKEAGLFF